ncbi:hypothetical protein JCM18882A_20780 [Brevibacterium metallidurans]|uniref:Uncharacterized protein n=1 Tax=Brevibacterium metallidurans TaxID=1482676 RepID=A0ABP3CBF7_9MICO
MPPRISWRTEEPRLVISKNLSSALGLLRSGTLVSDPRSSSDTCLSAIVMDHLKLFDLIGRDIVVVALRLERAH